jgi:hypothetical protein
MISNALCSVLLLYVACVQHVRQSHIMYVHIMYEQLTANVHIMYEHLRELQQIPVNTCHESLCKSWHSLSRNSSPHGTTAATAAAAAVTATVGLNSSW